jgi:DNA-binding NarL/FixJ family response regulator
VSTWQPTLLPKGPKMTTAAQPGPAVAGMIRVAMLDRHPTVRAGLDAFLRAEPDIDYVGGAADRYELWPLLRRTHPNVVVLEHGPGTDGLDLCLRVTAAPHAPRVVIFASELGADAVVPATLAGARAIVDKRAPRRELLEAIRAVAAGERVLPAIHPRFQARAAARLGSRDRAIFAMRLAGTTTADIAAVAGLDASDVRTSLAAIVGALGRGGDELGSGSLPVAA